VLGGFYAFGLVVSPWIIARNFTSPEKIPQAIVIFGIVFLLVLLFWSTAIAMHRRKPAGRTLALIAAAISLIVFWPIAIYTWWFIHSEGGKRIYRVDGVGPAGSIP
jgi:hypothetical protein